MPPLKLWSRPERPAPSLRTRLAVRVLDDRAAPSSLLAAEDDRQPEAARAASAAYLTPSNEPTSTMTPGEGVRAPTNLPPEIVDFVVVQIGPGQYQITGRVIDESPGGLVVTFGGVPSAEGQSATTSADGTFFLILTMQTDGSDTGLMTAVTQDSAGLSSNVATTWVDPH
jgi:hypothetical protein